MKKRIWVLGIVLVLLAVYILYLCIENGTFIASVDGKAKSVSTIDGVSISIKDDTLTATTAVIIIKNDTDLEYTTGEAFYIDKKVNGKWMKLKTNYDTFWTLVGIIIPSNSYHEFEYNWEDLYGKLKKGTYRFVKEINSKRIAVEFKVKD